MDNTGEQILDVVEDKVLPVAGQVIATLVINSLIPVLGPMVSTAVIEASKVAFKSDTPKNENK